MPAILRLATQLSANADIEADEKLTNRSEYFFALRSLSGKTSSAGTSTSSPPAAASPAGAAPAPLGDTCTTTVDDGAPPGTAAGSVLGFGGASSRRLRASVGTCGGCAPSVAWSARCASCSRFSRSDILVSRSRSCPCSLLRTRFLVVASSADVPGASTGSIPMLRGWFCCIQ